MALCIAPTLCNEGLRAAESILAGEIRAISETGAHPTCRDRGKGRHTASRSPPCRDWQWWAGSRSRLRIFNDGDTAWHLAAGRWIAANGRVPHSDPFSFTHRGQPWTAHEWLAELVMSGTLAAAGWAGLAFLCALAVGCTMWICAKALPLPARYSLLMQFGLFGTLAQFSLARPHVLAWPLLAGWAYLLAGARDAKKAPPALAGLVMLPWANLHASYILGLGLVGLFAVEALLESRDLRGTATRWAPFGDRGCARGVRNAARHPGLSLPLPGQQHGGPVDDHGVAWSGAAHRLRFLHLRRDCLAFCDQALARPWGHAVDLVVRADIPCDQACAPPGAFRNLDLHHGSSPGHGMATTKRRPGCRSASRVSGFAPRGSLGGAAGAREWAELAERRTGAGAARGASQAGLQQLHLRGTSDLPRNFTGDRRSGRYVRRCPYALVSARGAG